MVGHGLGFDARPRFPFVGLSGGCASFPHMLALDTRAALYLVTINRAGFREGAKLIEFIEEWQRCVSASRGPVTVEGFIQWTRRYSRRTTFERLASFRKTFPQLGPHGLPDGLMGPLLDRLAQEAGMEPVP